MNLEQNQPVALNDTSMVLDTMDLSLKFHLNLSKYAFVMAKTKFRLYTFFLMIHLSLLTCHSC
jgi:hypothetical protein